MKKIVSKDVLLAYPDFNLPFEIHMDASDRQLGVTIAQKGRLLAFYSRFPITVSTDHKNLTHDMVLLLSERVMQWQVLIEEFGLEIKYIKERRMNQENNKQNAIALLNSGTMLTRIFGSSPDDGFLLQEGEQDGAAPPVLKCADGDLCRFRTST
eukprot:8636958-Ditylum_brightwellii.AAC.1